MVDWAYVCGMADDSGNDPDEETHDPDGRCGSTPGTMFQQLITKRQPAVRSKPSGYSNRLNVYGPPLQCKHCGQLGVYWQTVKGAYRLHDIEGLTPHICPPKIDNLEGFDE